MPDERQNDGFGGGPVRAGRRRAPGQHRWVRAGPLLTTERGSAAAEFAVALPAVVLVLACCVGAVQVASQQVRLSDAAADAARTLARGDTTEVAMARVQRVESTATMRTSESGDFICVELSSPAGHGPAFLAGVLVRASACALAGGL